MSREKVVERAKAEAIAGGMSEEAAATFAEKLAGSDEMKTVISSSMVSEDLTTARQERKEAEEALTTAKAQLSEYEKQGKSDLELEKAKVAELEEKVAKLPDLEKAATNAEADKATFEKMFEEESKDFTDAQKALITETAHPREKLAQARRVKEALGQETTGSGGRRGNTYQGGVTVTKQELADMPLGPARDKLKADIKSGVKQLVD